MTEVALRPRWPLTFKLSHQHLQSADGGRERALQQRLEHLGLDAWGVVSMRPDEEALSRGVVAVTDFVAVLPSGLVADLARLETPWVEPRASEPEDTIVHVAFPREQPGAPAVASELPGDFPFRRESVTVADEHGPDHVTLETMRPEARLFLRTPPAGWDAFPLLRITRLGGRWVFDQRVVPPVLSVAASPALLALVRQLLSRLDARLRELRDLQRWDPADPERFDPSDVPLVWLVARLSGVRPRLAQVLEGRVVSPESLHTLLLELRGSLAGGLGVELASVAPFDRRALGDTFDVLGKDLERLLATKVPTPIEVVPLQRTDPFLYRVTVDRALLSRPLYLAATAPHALAVDDSFVALAKVGTSAVVAHAARSAVTGVPLSVAHELPPVLPRRDNRVYYRLDTTSSAWAEVAAGGDLAVYLPPREPPLELSLFVLK
ncbi:MAG: type VI secretion system baseplate subunit TssK [Myxococcales bacterium]|nr:type VI secretion system baseplate subunit TssK [Myxococcales bacterium]